MAKGSEHGKRITRDSSDDQRTVRYTADEIRQRMADGKTDETDWASIEAMTDEDIERAARDDPDWDGFLDIDWSTAEVVIPGKGRFPVSDIWKDLDLNKTTKQAISIRLDLDVVEFFRSQGKGWQTSINAVLRHYMASRRSK